VNEKIMVIKNITSIMVKTMVCTAIAVMTLIAVIHGSREQKNHGHQKYHINHG